MIGVAVAAAEQEAAREFFELFKTCWEFVQIGRHYDVVITTIGVAAGLGARLTLLYQSEDSTRGTDSGAPVIRLDGKVTLLEGEIALPIYGAVAIFPFSQNRLLTESSTRSPALAARRRGDAIVARIGYDLFKEIRYLLTVGQPPAYAAFPTLERHIALLRHLILAAGVSIIEIPPVPLGYSFIGCLSHDIDHPGLRNHGFSHTTAGFLYRATVGTVADLLRRRRGPDTVLRNCSAALMLPLVHLGLVEDPWKAFDHYIDLEQGFHSTFFAIASPYPGRTLQGPAPHERGCGYQLESIVTQLRHAVSSGCEVATHGLDAWIDRDAAVAERSRVAGTAQHEVQGVRMHWLYFGPGTFALLEEAGFSYDSSIGYNEAVGYRAGTTQVFRPLGSRHLLELPLHIMDTALFFPTHLNLGETEAFRQCSALVDDASTYGGALTVNWHDRSIAPERCWDSFYIKLLGLLRARSAWCPTSSDAVDWFRRRRAATITPSHGGLGRYFVAPPMPAPFGQPPLILRVHRPRGPFSLEPLAMQTSGEFTDYPLTSPREIDAPV